MSLNLKPVTAENWKDFIKMSVREDQKSFVASNLYSIAESQFGFEEEGHWQLTCHGLYDGDSAVGFAMTGLNAGHPQFQGLIVRLMVDEKFQGKGYGRVAMNLLIEDFHANDTVKNVCITYEPHNEVARKLYASCGFVETGEMLEGETVAILKIR